MMHAPYRSNRFPHRALCWFLAIVMATSQTTWVVAQQPAAVATESSAEAGAGFDCTYCSNRAFAAIFLHPRRVLTAPEMELLPIEVATAAGLEHVGIDPVDIEEVQAFIETPNYVVVFKLAKPFALDALKPQLTEHTTPEELDGKKYLKSGIQVAPSLYMPDAKTLFVGADNYIQRIVKGRVGDGSGPLAERLKASPQSDIFALVNLELVRPIIDMGLGQARQSADIPPEVAPLLDAPDYIRAVELSVDLVSKGSTHLYAYANNADDADKLEKLIDGSLETWVGELKTQTARMHQSDDPVERAAGQYLDRISSKVTDAYRPMRDGEKFVLFDFGPGADQKQLAMVGVVGILVALLLPAVQAAREAARRAQCMNNLQQLMLALHLYHDANGQFPANANYDANGKPLLSWRVHVLPYIEEQNLYEQFHLDEPWDSPHNKTLIEKMPFIYRCPSAPGEETKTNYVAPVGKGLFMEGSKGIQMRDFTDGTSNTIALVEVNDDQAVIWTKPDDMKWDPKNPLAGVGSYHPGGFQVGVADGSVHFFQRTIDAELFRALLTRNGGEVIGPNAF